MARRAARIDDNQNEIVEALRKAGASVQSLASAGKGVPDLLVGYIGQNILMEVKDGSKSPSRRKLTDDQVKWHDAWKGQVIIVENPHQAVLALLQAFVMDTTHATQN